jgi:putative nucleotidyltransferase with HDIG domain
VSYNDEYIRLHELIDIIIDILNVRDPYTYIHSERVAAISVLIANAMSLPDWHVEKIHVAAHLHDIGKIGVPDYILNKPGLLTPEETVFMQKHSVIGYSVLKRLPVFEEIAGLVLFHHERFDGKGYPSGIKGEDIPLESRIIAVADSYDAINSDRPYRKGLGGVFAVKEINRHKKNQFCPLVVRYFNLITDYIPDVVRDTEALKSKNIIEIGQDEFPHSVRLTEPDFFTPDQTP